MDNEEMKNWLSTGMAQLSYVINLFLGLATAVLGFSVSLIIDEKFILYGRNKYLFSSALLFELLSICLGIVAVVLRTVNFQQIYRITRSERSKWKLDPLLSPQVKRTAKITWRFLWAQLIFFVLGILSLLTCIFVAYRDKLL